LIDDGSREKNVDNILRDFHMSDNITVIKITKNKNYGMFHSLKIGYNILLNMGCKYFCNIDSDIIMKRDWFNNMKNMYHKLVDEYDENIILSSFNTIRYHKIHEEYEDYYIKQALGGINMFFSHLLYKKIQNFFDDRLWDYKIVHYMNSHNYKMISMKESQIQHIGFEGLNSFKNNNDYDFDFSYYEEDNTYRYYPCFEIKPNFDINKVEKNTLKIEEYKEGKMLKVEKSNLKSLKEIVMICNFETFENKMSNNYYKFCQYLAKTIEKYKVIMVGPGIKGYKKGMTIFEVIHTFCFTETPIIYIMDLYSSKVVKDLKIYEGYKILDYEDIVGRTDEIIKYINDNRINYAFHRYNCEEHSKVRDKCVYTTFINMPHFIDDTVFKNYGEKKIYDIFLYGAAWEPTYKFRKRLFDLMIQQKDLKVYYLEHPGYGEDNFRVKDADKVFRKSNIKHNITYEKLSRLINQSKITISTPSEYEYFIKKYMEIPLSNCVIAGRLPKEDGRILDNSIINLDNGMTDSEIVEKIKYYLNNETEYKKLLENGQQIIKNNFTFDHGKKRIVKYYKKIFNTKIYYNNTGYELNQDVSIRKFYDYTCITSLQNTSTPGIKKIFNLNKLLTYKIIIEGYKECDNDVLFWINDINTNKNILYEKNYALSKNNKKIEYIVKDKTKIYVGILFDSKNIKIGDKFYMKYIKVMEA